MGQNLSYIPMDSIVNDYLNESEQSVSKFYKIWHLAFRGFEDLGMDAFYKILAVKLPINDNLTVTLPANYLQWTKVGLLNDRGEIIPLYYNNKLTSYMDLSPDRLTQTQDNSVLNNINYDNGVWSNYWNGHVYANIYGVPSGAPFLGNFKVDVNNGVILLNERYQYDYLMLEYMASPKEGSEYYIPVQFREALIAWLYWKDNKAKGVRSHMALGLSRDYKNDYYRERRNSIARWKPTRDYDIYQASQEMSRQAIKS